MSPDDEKTLLIASIESLRVLLAEERGLSLDQFPENGSLLAKSVPDLKRIERSLKDLSRTPVTR
jgi:hypothetical protein